MTRPKYPIKTIWNSKGSIDAGTIGLVIAAGISLVLIVLAARMLLGGSNTKPPVKIQPQPEPGDSPKAPTQTIEQVLESVQVYVSGQDYSPAVTILQAAIGKYPTDHDLRFALGDLYLQMSNYQGAYEQYVAAIEYSEGVDAKAQFTAGTLASMIDQPELAEVHYLASMRADPNNADTPLYLANIQFTLNKLEDAKVSLAIAGKMTPDRAQVWATWAQIALRQNKLSIAVQQIEKARKFEPRVPAWSILEAKIQKRAGDPERSIELLIALPESELDNAEVIRILAESYGMIGRPEDAASRMVDFAQLHPNDPQAAFDAAVWLQRAKQREQAVLWGRRARDLGHSQAEGWLSSLP